LGKYVADQEAQLAAKLTEVCGKTPCFDIRLSHIGLFGLNVMFVAPNMNFELLKLRQGFFADCGFGDDFWAAHATILMDKPQVILQALPVLAENFKPFTAKIESVGLYEFFPARLVAQCDLLRDK